MKHASHRRATTLDWPTTRDGIRNAVLLAGATLFAAFPMFHYQYQRLAGLLLTVPPPPELLQALALQQALLVFLMALLCALVGFLYADRLQLPRFGTLADIRFWLPAGLLGGLLLTPLTYLIVDQSVLALQPALFPDTWSWALAEMLGSALTQEVLARFGLLTVALYFLQRWHFRGWPWPAVLLIATLGVAGTALFLSRFDLLSQLTTPTLFSALALAFGLQWLFCVIYLRWGFLAVVSVHVGLAVKWLVYALLWF